MLEFWPLSFLFCFVFFLLDFIYQFNDLEYVTVTYNSNINIDICTTSLPVCHLYSVNKSWLIENSVVKSNKQLIESDNKIK